jgi:hypothetical protein
LHFPGAVLIAPQLFTACHLFYQSPKRYLSPSSHLKFRADTVVVLHDQSLTSSSSFFLTNHTAPPHTPSEISHQAVRPPAARQRYRPLPWTLKLEGEYNTFNSRDHDHECELCVAYGGRAGPDLLSDIRWTPGQIRAGLVHWLCPTNLVLGFGGL